MTPPPTIPFSSVILGERGRSIYSGIENLAQSIVDSGLIQPIVLVPLPDGTFGVDAGGRRFTALALLLSDGRWDGTLHHAATSDPTRPGYILKGEAFATPFQRLMTEIAENLHRDDMDWRDQLKLIVKAYRMSVVDANSRGEDIIMADFGAMLGVSYSKLQAAQAVHDDLILNPDRYKDCTGIRQAYTKILKAGEVAVTKALASRSIISSPNMRPEALSVPIQIESQPGVPTPPIQFPLSNAFKNVDSLAYMKTLTSPTFDHIITDPDYGVSVERLEASVNTQAGVAQFSIDASLQDLCDFFVCAWTVIKPQGFLVLWYDLDHHEKLQQYAEGVGFSVQRWPLIWHKTDYFSNAAPSYNFTKNIEYAMVCRKPTAVLSQVQKSSVFMCASGTTARDFNHPFAKPLDVWKWIYSAVTIKGQTVYDPFLGSGTSAVAAVQWGLKPVGGEIDAGNYATAILNLQKEYRKLLGSNVIFS